MTLLQERAEAARHPRRSWADDTFRARDGKRFPPASCVLIGRPLAASAYRAIGVAKEAGLW